MRSWQTGGRAIGGSVIGSAAHRATFSKAGDSMIDFTLAQIRSLAERWQNEVARRRAITRVDPVADAIAYCARDLEESLRQVEESTAMLTPGEFAQLHRTTSQTVTAWCRSGKISGAIPNGRSWLIPRSAAAPRMRQRRAR